MKTTIRLKCLLLLAGALIMTAHPVSAAGTLFRNGIRSRATPSLRLALIR